MLNYLCAAAGGAGNIVIYVVLIIALLFILIAPYFTQRKRNKQYTEMLSSIRVGDLVKTIGGIIGKVTKITDKGEIKTVILETGTKTEKSYMEFDITHIACVLKSSKAPTEEAETAEQAKTESKAEKGEETKAETAEKTDKAEETKPANEPNAEAASAEKPAEEKQAKAPRAKKTEGANATKTAAKKPASKKTSSK